MKTFLLIITLAFGFVSNAQWKYQTVDNGFDEPYKIAYTADYNEGFLKLENIEGNIFFYLQGGYHCEEFPEVDLLFIVNGVNKKYTITAFTSNNKESVFFTANLQDDDFYEDFKNASYLKIRINETTCHTDIYTFNMTNSFKALSFMLK